MEHDDDKTPAPAPAPSGRPSPDAYSVAYLVTCLEQLTVALRPVAARYDAAEDDERRDIAAGLEPVCREVGNVGHELARTMTELLLGVRQR